VHVGCWAHVRRKFFEAKLVSKQAGSAEEALASIDRLFAVERTLRAQELPGEEFARLRRAEVQPLLEKLGSWLQMRQVQVPPSTTLGKAIGYALDQWPKLQRYLDSPLLRPDNNACEQAIRPFVVGRKNWLIAGSPVGAKASAGWYSLIQTVKPIFYISESAAPGKGDRCRSSRTLLISRTRRSEASQAGFAGFISSPSWRHDDVPKRCRNQSSSLE
jgi:transposase